MSAHRGPGTGSGKDRFFVQAPIPALDEDGTKAFATGTLLAAAFTLVMLLARRHLAQAQLEWLLWVGVCCTVIGMGGLGYCRVRRYRMRDQ
ncbi:hypothetical protein [Propionibacterium sp.]|uniref:hypothetical protein n=1 Tax=Propionibacterium sp. TaxID=1977903 RepID=UPI0039E99695